MPDTPTPDPAQLRAWLQGAARQDAAAFRSLYDATSARLYGFALRILAKHELAEEALQDSYVAIWHGAATYQSQLSAPMTWMTTIVRNKSLDLLRVAGGDAGIERAPFDSRVVDALRDPGRTPVEALEMSQDAQALVLCMALLDALHRQAVGLAFFHELSHAEVASQMGLPIGTVKTWIRRSLERLKSCLEKDGQR